METRTEHHCPGCDTTKPADEFYKRTTAGNPTSICKDCSKEKNRRYHERYLSDPTMQARKKHNYLMSMFGLSLQEYNDLVAKQNGVCAICSGTNQSGNALSVDHNHDCCPGTKSCGRCVRGLLCNKCNMGLETAVNHINEIILYAKEYGMGVYGIE